MSDYSTMSDNDLIQMFQNLDKEMTNRSKTYEMFHILYNSRRRSQSHTTASVFYQQLLSLYQTDSELHLRFDPILIRLIKLFDQSIYSVEKINIPLHKQPKLRNLDDGDYLHEITELVDTYDIFTPQFICTNVTVANDFVDKIQMVSWSWIIKSYDIWVDIWTKFVREKGSNLSHKQLQNHRDNPDVKRNRLAQAFLTVNKNIVEKLIKEYENDKTNLCQAILDNYDILKDE